MAAPRRGASAIAWRRRAATRRYLRASAAPTAACEPSTSWSTALPMSWSRPARRASLTLQPELAGHHAGQEADLDRVLQQVLRVRLSGTCSRPRQRTSSGCTACRPRSNTACSPASLHCCLDLRRRTCATTSSMRVGWMRPSAMRRGERELRDLAAHRVEAARSMTASGVSSMMRSMPVAASSARMLRPSRPMMRPFRSSRRQRHHRDGALGDVLAGVALDGGADDASSSALRPRLARLVLDLLDLDGGGLLGVVDDLRHQLLARVVGATCRRASRAWLATRRASSAARRAVASAACSRPATRLLLLVELGLASLRGVPDFLASSSSRRRSASSDFCSSARRCFELVGGLGLCLERHLLGFELRGAFDLGGFGARGFDELLRVRPRARPTVAFQTSSSRATTPTTSATTHRTMPMTRHESTSSGARRERR